MPRPQVLILRAPGTNCDEETAYAFERVGGRPRRVHVNRLLESPRLLDEFQVLCLPGGFSYGDDIAAGRILASQIQIHLGGRLAEFREAGKLILGICNGFQALLKCGLLFGDGDASARVPAPATLTWNDSGKFEDRWVTLRSDGTRCVFFRGLERLYLPVAHAEGKFVARDTNALSQMEQARQLVLRYALPDDEQDAASPNVLLPFPHNPNGSAANVAGVCDPSGRVCGLMPHPERHVEPTQHPHWTRKPTLPPHGDGLAIFQNAVSYFD